MRPASHRAPAAPPALRARVAAGQALQGGFVRPASPVPVAARDPAPSASPPARSHCSHAGCRCGPARSDRARGRRPPCAWPARCARCEVAGHGADRLEHQLRPAGLARRQRFRRQRHGMRQMAGRRYHMQRRPGSHRAGRAGGIGLHPAAASVPHPHGARGRSNASAAQSPRAIAFLSMPAGLSAQRCPAAPVSLGRFCAWMPRTRSRSPAGISRRSALSSPARARPACAVPVTTVPWPASVKAVHGQPEQAVVAALAQRLGRLVQNDAAAVPCRRRQPARRGSARRRASRKVPAVNAAMPSRAAASCAASARSALVSATAPRAAPAGQDGQVLARLRHDAVVGRHDQKAEVDAAGAGGHGVTSFVAGRR